MRNYLFLFLVFVGCGQKADPFPNNVGTRDTTLFAGFSDTATSAAKGDSSLPDKIIAFAKTQIGVRYKYCSMSPEGGFDCSGFVNYVFNHFNIKVPRSSVDFTNAGDDVALDHAQPGDLILFTGTDPHKKVVGHIGIIVTNNNGDIDFIQATSGMAYSVVISPLDRYYMSRFVKVIRIRK